jgi:hypothetical protein
MAAAASRISRGSRFPKIASRVYTFRIQGSAKIEYAIMILLSGYRGLNLSPGNRRFGCSGHSRASQRLAAKLLSQPGQVLSRSLFAPHNPFSNSIFRLNVMPRS